MDKKNPNTSAADKVVDNKNNRGDGTFKISGDWHLQAEVLKDKFPQLTDADLKYEPGNEDALLTRLETKLNKHRGEVVNIIRKGSAEKA